MSHSNYPPPQKMLLFQAFYLRIVPKCASCKCKFFSSKYTWSIEKTQRVMRRVTFHWPDMGAQEIIISHSTVMMMRVGLVLVYIVWNPLMCCLPNPVPSGVVNSVDKNTMRTIDYSKNSNRNNGYDVQDQYETAVTICSVLSLRVS